MKLAEALLERANLQKRIIEVKDKIIRSAVTQEDIEPPENTDDLLNQLAEMYRRLSKLIGQINKTNSSSYTRSSVLLSDALAERDVASLKHAHYRDIGFAGVVAPRVGRAEIKFKSNVPSDKLLKLADKAAQLRREIDVEIQEANWTVDLIED